MMKKQLTNINNGFVVRLVIIPFVILSLIFIVLWRQPVTEVNVADYSCFFTEPEFKTRWIHSVEKQWWEEWYELQSDHLLLTKTYFQAFGAGTPSTEKVTLDSKPGYVGYRIDQKLPKINWIVSRLTKGEIEYASHKLIIHQLVPDYSEVVIIPNSYNVFEILIKESCNDSAQGWPHE